MLFTERCTNTQFLNSSRVTEQTPGDRERVMIRTNARRFCSDSKSLTRFCNEIDKDKAPSGAQSSVASTVLTCLHPGRTEHTHSKYDCSSVITSHLSSFKISPSSEDVTNSDYFHC